MRERSPRCGAANRRGIGCYPLRQRNCCKRRRAPADPWSRKHSCRAPTVLELVHRSGPLWFPARGSGDSGLRHRVDSLPDPLRCRRHVKMSDAVWRQRVDHRVHHGGRRGDRADLAAPLDPERIVPATGTLRRHRDRRQVIRARHLVIHKRTSEELAARRS